jgi:dUTP pyrophosphatase
MEIRIKKLVETAVVPTYAAFGDAGLDLTATSVNVVDNTDFGYIEYGIGLAFEIPYGYVGLLFPRSSVSKTGLILANSVGVVDSEYREEVKLRFKYIAGTKKYGVGERVGQIMILPYPIIDFEVAEELTPSNRGGFGSTGL